MSVSVHRPPVARSWGPRILAFVLTVILLGTVGALATILLGRMVVSYTITEDALLVDSGSWPDGERSIPLRAILSQRAVELRGARRTRGTGLAGLCSGQWSYDELGTVWQATSCSPHAIVLEIEGESRPVVLTPPDREGFLAALAARTPTSVELPPADVGMLRVFLGAILVLVLAINAMLVPLMLVGSRAMRYTIEDGQLELRTLFGRRRLSCASLRARRHTPQVTLRLAGTAFGGYYTGLFRADGENTRLYATHLGAGVLIEGPLRVFVTPEDVDAFLLSLRAAGADVAITSTPS